MELYMLYGLGIDWLVDSPLHQGLGPRNFETHTMDIYSTVYNIYIYVYICQMYIFITIVYWYFNQSKIPRLLAWKWPWNWAYPKTEGFKMIPCCFKMPIFFQGCGYQWPRHFRSHVEPPYFDRDHPENTLGHRGQKEKFTRNKRKSGGVCIVLKNIGSCGWKKKDHLEVVDC